MLRHLFGRGSRRFGEKRKRSSAPPTTEPVSDTEVGISRLRRGAALLGVEPEFAFGERTAKDFFLAFVENGPNVRMMELKPIHDGTQSRSDSDKPGRSASAGTSSTPTTRFYVKIGNSCRAISREGGRNEGEKSPAAGNRRARINSPAIRGSFRSGISAASQPAVVDAAFGGQRKRKACGGGGTRSPAGVSPFPLDDGSVASVDLRGGRKIGQRQSSGSRRQHVV
jgi:hypothetical protein